ncbi:MAG: hypothetical protein KDA68_10975 [Planctomycetaceae bacterium]|nr:hypothetical protein [Planctomycetaceae bacterium]
MNFSQIRKLFAVAALYDGFLGVLFLLIPGSVFYLFSITPPNHFGYVQFSAALLIIFGLMFLKIALDPRENASLILYGILLKISYCGLTFYYWFGEGIPWIWKPFAIFDLIMLVLFIWAAMTLREKS